MGFMEWTAHYSVGVAIFDDEHKKLIALINKLHEAIEAGVDKPALAAIADGLVEYTLMHFRHEEMYFEDWAFPAAAEHCAMHAELRRQVFDYRRKIQELDAAPLAKELTAFLRDWLTQHILVEDRKYGAFLFDKGLR